jgi:DUF1680 family protein
MSSISKPNSLTRREFGGIVAAAAAIPGWTGAQNPPPRQADGTPPPQRRLVPDTPAFDSNLEFTLNPRTARAAPFPMTQVRLLPNNVFHDSQQWNRSYMARLDADRMLYTFRANAGLPPGPAKPLGGWEQPENGQRSSELRGHFGGHFLSASALLYASTGDTAAKSKADYMVAELAKCQERLGGKYLSAFPTTWFDRLEKGERVWAPFYTIHKIAAGMWDMYRLAGNRQALHVLEGMAAWHDEWTAPKPFEHMQQILTIEFGGIAETLYHLAAETRDPRWGRVGDRFQKRSFINPLAMGRDELRGLHVNTHVPQAIAAARRYEVSGDSRFRDVADFFFHQVSTARSYVTGGTSNAEAWLAPPHRLAAELKMSPNTAECCCAYNMMKLARQLYAWRPDPSYFDYYDRLLLNHRIGTIRPDVGTTQYYLSLTSGVWKTFNTEEQTFWCCTGSGIEEYAKLNDSIYWRDNDGLYVNLFIPSELDWAEKGFRLRQDTGYPRSQSTTLTVVAARSEPLAMRVRIPAWLRSAPRIRVNGNALDATAAPGSYLTLNRAWKAGDRVEMELPMHLHVEAMSDDPGLQAFLYGPLVLAGDLGGDGLTEAHISGPNLRVGAPNVEQNGSPLAAVNRTPPVPDLDIPTFRAPAADPSAWIKATDKPQVFRTTGQKQDVTLVPLNSLFDRRYAVYWRVEPAGGPS